MNNKKRNGAALGIVVILVFVFLLLGVAMTMGSFVNIQQARITHAIDTAFFETESALHITASQLLQEGMTAQVQAVIEPLIEDMMTDGTYLDSGINNFANAADAEEAIRNQMTAVLGYAAFRDALQTAIEEAFIDIYDPALHAWITPYDIEISFPSVLFETPTIQSGNPVNVMLQPWFTLTSISEGTYTSVDMHLNLGFSLGFIPYDMIAGGGGGGGGGSDELPDPYFFELNNYNPTGPCLGICFQMALAVDASGNLLYTSEPYWWDAPWPWNTEWRCIRNPSSFNPNATGTHPITGATLTQQARTFNQIESGTDAQVNAQLAANWILAEDIDLQLLSPGVHNWVPIGGRRPSAPAGAAGTGRNSFTGRFNGNGHSITGLQSNWPNRNGVGLFGLANNAWIGNFSVYLSGDMIGNSRVGVVVGASGTPAGGVHGSTGTVSGFVYGSNFHPVGTLRNIRIVGERNADGNILHELRISSGTGGYAGALIGYFGHGAQNLNHGNTPAGTNSFIEYVVAYNIRIRSTYSLGRYVGGLIGTVRGFWTLPSNAVITSLGEGRAAIIRNVAVIGGDVLVANFNGGLVGYLYGSNILLERGYVDANTIVASEQPNSIGNYTTGGAIGRIAYHSGRIIVRDVITRATVRSFRGATSDLGGVGGFIGELAANYRGGTLIYRSAAYGNVIWTGSGSGDSGRNFGGFVGHLGWTTSSHRPRIRDSYARNDVVGRDDVGGFVGRIRNSAESSSLPQITNTYTVGQVLGNVPGTRGHFAGRSNNTNNFGGTNFYSTTQAALGNSTQAIGNRTVPANPGSQPQGAPWAPSIGDPAFTGDMIFPNTFTGWSFYNEYPNPDTGPWNSGQSENIPPYFSPWYTPSFGEEVVVIIYNVDSITFLPLMFTEMANLRETTGLTP